MSGVWAALMGLGGVLAQHVILAACAIGLGIAVALPLAVWASRSRERGATPRGVRRRCRRR